MGGGIGGVEPSNLPLFKVFGAIYIWQYCSAIKRISSAAICADDMRFEICPLIKSSEGSISGNWHINVFPRQVRLMKGSKEDWK